MDGRVLATWQDDENLVSYHFYFLYSVGQECIYAVTGKKAFLKFNSEQTYHDVTFIFEPAA
ncbi:hypothetical protein FRC01_003972 [Tulasnella sp. 417]|nr:hypothetical protein FRC01_003972 [Tulasnella sp. 417]